jgi:uncharacterized protein with GYD domain
MVLCPEKGEVSVMHFIALVKFKKKPTKENIAESLKRLETEGKEGIKYHGIYWTLGRYDAVALFEAPNEKVAMKMAIGRAEDLAMETLVAVPAEEARKLVV